jgi:hypothetical protein
MQQRIRPLSNESSFSVRCHLAHHRPPHPTRRSLLGPQTTRPSTPSASSTSSGPHSSLHSSSTIPTPSQRSSGLSPSSSSPSLSSRSFSSSSAQAKQKPSRRTISLPSAHTAGFTSLTGYTGVSSSSGLLPRVVSLLLTLAVPASLQLFCRGSCRPDLNRGRTRTDRALPRLLLCVLHQVRVSSPLP